MQHFRGQSRCLVLHFDVNKTILMADPAGGKTIEDVAQDLVSSNAWGKIELDSTSSSGKKWTPVSSKLFVESPKAEDPEVVNYKEFIDNVHLPYPKLKTTKEEQGKANKIVKEQRNDLYRRFTKPNEVGSQYDEFYKEVMHSLSLNDGTDKYHFIIPSFYKLIKHLSDEEINFRIVFRTFGTDLPEILEAITEFCEGKHPSYPGLSLPHLKPQLDKCTGAFFRNEDTSCLTLNTIEKPATMAGGLDFYKSHEHFISGYENIYNRILQLLSTQHCLGFTDYYPWWSSNNESGYAGKLFLINPEDTQYHQIFFDDNIYEDGREKNIVDVRNLVTKESLPMNGEGQLYASRAEPRSAVVDEDYYIKEVTRMCNKLN